MLSGIKISLVIENNADAAEVDAAEASTETYSLVSAVSVSDHRCVQNCRDDREVGGLVFVRNQFKVIKAEWMVPINSASECPLS